MNDQPGMQVMLVNTESPAWTVGIKHGDILLEINGKQVNNIEEYRAALAQALETSSRVELKVLRRDTVKVFAVQFDK